MINAVKPEGVVTVSVASYKLVIAFSKNSLVGLN